MLDQLLHYAPLLAIVVGIVGGTFKLIVGILQKQIDQLIVERDKWESLALQGMRAAEHTEQVARQIERLSGGTPVAGSGEKP